MMIKDFKKRFLICFFISIPILLLSPMIQQLFNYTFRFKGDLYILFLFSSFIFFYGGWPFLKGCYHEILNKNPGMMTLIGLAISTAYLYSTIVIFGLKGKIFFWELVTLVDIMLLGHWIEMKSVLAASHSLELLVKMIPSSAHLIKKDKIKDVKIEDLKIDDVILVKPGEQIPTDGIIIEGTGYLNESMLTGESKPVKKEINNRVIGGSLNGNSSLKIKTLYLGKDSYLSKVINMVEEAQKAKSKTERLADKAAKWLTFIAIFSGIITFILWLLIDKTLSFSLERMVTVMVISCPHALGLAIPLIIARAINLAARSGLLIRNRTAFENARKITTVVFDKTGTLTKGTFQVEEYDTFSKNYSADDILQFAGSIEQHSEHTIAQGILEKAKNKKLNILEVKNFKNIPGEGVKGDIGEKFIQIVGFSYLKNKNISIKQTFPLESYKTVVFLLIDNKVEGYLSLSDQIRPESYETIKKLKKNKIKTIMITGDNENVSKIISKKLNLDKYYANILPDKKLEIIKNLQEKGEFIAMTGDGINDAPALAQANIGIAIGSGTDVTAETADIILVKSNPLDILTLIIFGKATYKKMIQNLFWATAYNSFAIPMAAGVLYSYKIIITPAIGAILMSLSTIIVALNGYLLKIKKNIGGIL